MSEPPKSENKIEELTKIADGLYEKKCYHEAIIIYKSLLKLYTDEVPYLVLFNMGVCYSNLRDFSAALPFLKQCLERLKDDPEVYRLLGDAYYYGDIDHNQAMVYYEKFTEFVKTNGLVYNMLGHLYATKYGHNKVHQQIEYFKKAFSLIPNDKSIVKNYIIAKQKTDDIKTTDSLFKVLMTLKPNNIDYFDYAAHLISKGDFSGYQYLDRRFKKETNPVPYPEELGEDTLWKGQDIKDSVLLVHCEQGFGDTFMFARFVLDILDKTKKIIFIVQSELFDLMKESFPQVEVHPIGENLSKYSFDYHIPLMSLPDILKIQSNNISHSEGYLSISEAETEEFRQKYIDTDKKLKIGIAYGGNVAFGGIDRDIPLSKFYKLARLDYVQLYSLQVGDRAEQLKDVPSDISVIDLGKYFKNFVDTAAAIKNMDLIISSDCGVLNLAGALGVKTYLLLNSHTDYRWFKRKGDDVGWYKSVKPFQNTTFNNWDQTINNVIKEIKIQQKKSKK